MTYTRATRIYNRLMYTGFLKEVDGYVDFWIWVDEQLLFRPNLWSIEISFLEKEISDYSLYARQYVFSRIEFVRNNPELVKLKLL